MCFDLSALEENARIYRARLLISRPDRYGSSFDIVPAECQGEKVKADGLPAQAGKSLELVAPYFRWFDATDAVRKWARMGEKTGLLWSRKTPSFNREMTFLEITYEGQLKDPPKQVSDLKCFYRSGQVFLTWREIEDIADGQEQVNWGFLFKSIRGINYEGPIPNDDQRELRYRVYRYSEPITATTIGEAMLLAEVANGSAYNTRLVPSGDFIERRPEAIAKRLAVEPGKPLPPGVGLYVHTVNSNGQAYYAVVTSINGVENTVNISSENSVGPIDEKVVPPEPVLQEENITSLSDGVYHEQWYSYWAAPPLAPRPLRYDLAVGFCPDTMAHPAPLTVHRGHTWQDNPEMPQPQVSKGIVMSHSADGPYNGFWTGINDARDTLKGVEEGKWQPFTQRRQEALIRWMQKKWEIDEQRITSAIGAWGLWEIKRADLYAYIHGWGMPEVTKGFQCWDWARGVWGQPSAYEGKPDEENPFFLQDYTNYVLSHPEKELPYFYIHTGWGAHFTMFVRWPHQRLRGVARYEAKQS